MSHILDTVVRDKRIGGASVASGSKDSCLILEFTKTTNATGFNSGDKFFSDRAKFAINMFVSILAVVYNVPAHTRHTSGICNSAGTLVFSSVANSAFRGGRNIFFAGGTTFAIVLRVVFNFSKAIVQNVTCNASGACNGEIHMSAGLVLATWAYGTIEESSNGCTLDVATA